MRMEIYYFTGTGNSLEIARGISDQTGAVLIPIASVIHRDSIRSDADAIGIIFPVYYGDLPIIIKEFAAKLEGLENRYVYAVCNYGGGAATSLKTLRQLLLSRGVQAFGGFSLHMPQNAFRKKWENHEKLYQKSKKKLASMIRRIQAGNNGIYHANPLLEWIIAPLFALVVRPVFTKHFRTHSNLPHDKPLDDHIRAMDHSFRTNESCNGCGTCEKICPVCNIEIRANRPAWKGHCENCLACYNWCPQKAIFGGVSNKDFYYRHPAVKLSDMLAQRKSGFPASSQKG